MWTFSNFKLCLCIYIYKSRLDSVQILLSFYLLICLVSYTFRKQRELIFHVESPIFAVQRSFIK